MNYYVYILYSEKCERYYVGHSDNVERRLEEHNSGRGGKYTKSCKPWRLVYNEIYENKALAVNREMDIKKKKSRKFIEKLIDTKKTNINSLAD
jgi:putative endonuclease